MMLINLTGQKIGRLTILYQVESGKYNGSRWMCQCECGNNKIIGSRFLREGRSHSCGCLRSEGLDLIGKRFGRWIALYEIQKDGKKKSRSHLWLCKCDCGTEKIVSAKNLTSGNSKSCGCFLAEASKSRVILEFGLAAKRYIYARYRDSARKRNLPFELSFEQFLSLVKQNCYYCGIEPFKEYIPLANNGSFIYQGIDRVDNNEGYTVKNSAPCCSPCNYAKNNMPQDEFISWIKRASKNINQISSGYEC